MAETRKLKTIEEIQAEYLEMSTNKGPETDAKNLASKLLHNNYKMCLFAKLCEQEVVERKENNTNDPKIELLKNAKASLEMLKQYYENIRTENSELRDERMELKLKRKRKRYFDKNKNMYVEYREKIFPMLMLDCDKKEELINELNKNASGNISETDLIQVTEELEKVTKENDLLAETEANIIEARRQNEVIEVETCRIQVRNMEMETEIRLFDEYLLENKITEMEDKMKDSNASTSKPDKKKRSEFKNPNDFPTLLDFLDKSKKFKQKKKRKLLTPANPPSKRRKNMTGSYSQHEKDGKKPNIQPSSPARSLKNSETEKTRVMESIGLKLNISSNNNSGMLQRTYASRNLGKPSTKPQVRRSLDQTDWDPSGPQRYPTMTCSPSSSSNSSNSRPALQRQKSSMNLSEKPQTPSLGREYRPTRRKAYHELETDENGHLLLQRFSSGPLFTYDDEPPKSQPPKTVQKSNVEPKVKSPFIRPEWNGKQSKPKPTKSGSLERMETNMNCASVSKQPTERGLRPRKSSKSQKISPKKVSPKKAEMKHDKKEIIRKKVKSPKKEVRKSRGKKKANKGTDNEMIVDEDSSSTDDNSNENQMIVDENNAMTSGDNTDKLMTVDENPLAADKVIVVDENLIVENSIDSNLNAVAQPEALITESSGNNGMEVDLNAQILQNDDTNMPDISSNDAEEVNMEQESPADNISNIEIFDMEIENVDPEASPEMSKSFEQLFCTSPNSSGNLELNKSFDFNFDNSRELSETDSSGNKVVDDFFNFDNGTNDKDDFFGDGSFKSNEGKADDFF
ncbi:unnamed protein product [Chironomus riparius]|uniref:Uncharacterized protein n=1 Tax=Chironomus riparius TaxID=315576 RepID=A0A9N9RJL4_9DIPT|nr:unnamed protein product [Chironomus riparius]